MSAGALRIAILGGTRFVGRAITDELIRVGHHVMLVHRGTGGCGLFPDAAHLHVDRAELGLAADRVRSFDPQVLVDVNGMTAADVVRVAPVFARCAKVVVISSCDVYQAYASCREGEVSASCPIRETSPVRVRRRVFPHSVPGCPEYDKLDVEDAWRDFPAVVLRSTAVYGPHDHLAREAFIVDRVNAGRVDIPFGVANHLYTRVSAAELATSVRLVVEGDGIDPGQTFNVAEQDTLSVEQWARTIAAVMGGKIRLVRVPEEVLPPDLVITAERRQHLVISSERARAVFDWRSKPIEQRIEESVRWHAARRRPRSDFTADDVALGSRTSANVFKSGG